MGFQETLGGFTFVSRTTPRPQSYIKVINDQTSLMPSIYHYVKWHSSSKFISLGSHFTLFVSQESCAPMKIFSKKYHQLLFVHLLLNPPCLNASSFLPSNFLKPLYDHMAFSRPNIFSQYHDHQSAINY